MSKTKDAPVSGKVYALTSASGPSIAAGNSWSESEVRTCTACGKPLDRDHLDNGD